MAENYELQVFYRVCTCLMEKGVEKYSKVAYEIGRGTSILACSIWRYSNNSLNRLGHFASSGQDIIMEWLPNLDYKMAETVVTTGQQLVKSHISLKVHQPGLIALPIRTDSGVEGVINFWVSSVDDGGSLSTTLARELAQQIGADFAREFRTPVGGECLKKQEQVRSLFETLPLRFDEGGVSVAARGVNSSVEDGCFYELFPQGNKILFSFGEVSGNSLAIPAFKLTVRLLVNALVEETQKPEEVLARLNSLLYPELTRVGSPLNIFLGFFDMSKGHLVFANGGQFPPLLVRGISGQVVKLKATGPFLGLDKLSQWEAGVIQLKKDDIFVFYNRGLVETINDKGKVFDPDRLARVMQKYLFYGASSLLDYIVLDYNEFLGNRQVCNSPVVGVIKIKEEMG